MKLYENFVSEMRDSINFKLNVIEEYVNYMDKYDLEYLLVFLENDTYNILTMNHHDADDTYHVEIECHENGKYIQEKSGYVTFDYNIDVEMFKILDDGKKNILDIERTIDDAYDSKYFYNILKSSDLTNVKISDNIFVNFDEETKFMNTEEFQELLFSKYPKLAKAFMSFIDSKSNYAKIELLPVMMDRYPELYEEYKKSKKAKDFNL